MDRLLTVPTDPETGMDALRTLRGGSTGGGASFSKRIRKFTL